MSHQLFSRVGGHQPGNCSSYKMTENKRKLLQKSRAALRKVRQENSVLKRRMKIKDNKLRRMLNKDQLTALGRHSTKGLTWG